MVLDVEVIVDVKVKAQLGVEQIGQGQVLRINVAFIAIKSLRGGVLRIEHPAHQRRARGCRGVRCGGGTDDGRISIDGSRPLIPGAPRSVGRIILERARAGSRASAEDRRSGARGVSAVVNQALCDTIGTVPLAIVIVGVIKVEVCREILVEFRRPRECSIEIIEIVFNILVIAVGLLLLIADAIGQLILDNRATVIDLLAEIGIPPLPARRPGAQIQVDGRMIRVEERLLGGVVNVAGGILRRTIDHAGRPRDNVRRLIGVGFKGKPNARIEFLNAVLVDLRNSPANRRSRRRHAGAGLRHARRIFGKVIISRDRVFLKLAGSDLRNLSRRVLHSGVEAIKRARGQNRQCRLLNRNTLDHDLLQLLRRLAARRRCPAS